eukprot:COSAG03_NODE_80_length_14027_cov_69.115953_1_plen_79_part_00
MEWLDRTQSRKCQQSSFHPDGVSRILDLDLGLLRERVADDAPAEIASHRQLDCFAGENTHSIAGRATIAVSVADWSYN